MLPLPPSLPLTHSPELVPGAAPAGPQPRPPTAVDPDAEPTLLRHPQARPGAGGWVRAGPGLWPPRQLPLAGGPGSGGPVRVPPAPPCLCRSLEPPPQGTVVFTTHVPALGRYAFLLHGFQPAHPTFAVEVLVNGGRIWQGEWLWRAVGTEPGRGARRDLTHAMWLCGPRGPEHGARRLAGGDRSSPPRPRCQSSNEVPPCPLPCPTSWALPTLLLTSGP